jgi:hypothetical protein
MREAAVPAPGLDPVRTALPTAGEPPPSCPRSCRTACEPQPACFGSACSRLTMVIAAQRLGVNDVEQAFA